jgi:hypothetical protein
LKQCSSHRLRINVIGKIKDVATTIKVDQSEKPDLILTVTKDGSSAKAKNLKKNEVVSVTRNLDQDILTFETAENTITGKITTFTAASESECAYATINGTEYKVDYNAAADCSTGLEATVSLDKYNRIGYVTSDTVISASEKYGWIMNSYLADDKSSYIIKLFSQDGTAKEYQLADKVNYWGPQDTSSRSGVSPSTIQEELENGSYNTDDSLGVDIRLVKYSVNSSDKITKLYCATKAKSGYTKDSSYSDANKTYDRKALVMGTSNMNGKVSAGNMLDTYYLNDGLIEFTVPNSNSDMTKVDNYSISTAKASAYLEKENGLAKDCIFGEFSDSKQTYPTVVVNFVGSVDNAAVASDYGTADNNPCFMVKRIENGVDDDNDEVYTLVGYLNGGEVKYTTKKNTLLTKVTGALSGSAAKVYNTTDLWNAVDGMLSTGKALYPSAKNLQDIIGVGDIIGVQNNGSILMLMLDASELADGVLSGNVPTLYDDSTDNANTSTTRDQIYIGKVSDSDLGDNAMITVAGRKTVFDTSRGMDTLLIDEAGKVTLSAENSSTIADITDFDEDSNTGDYAFVRYANKGTLQEIYLFRFED